MAATPDSQISQPDADASRGTFWDQPITRGKLPGARQIQMVRYLKLGLPLVAAMLVTTVMAWPRIQAAMAPERHVAASPPSAGKNQLVNPSFKGLDDNNEPYIVGAAHAVQSLDNQNLILLDKPTGDVLLNSGHHVGSEADKGTYLQQEKTLLLEGNVVLHEDEGYRFTTTKALVNTDTQQAFTDRPVQGGGPDGYIQASGLQGYNNDRVLVFTGPARLRLYPTPLPAVNAPLVAPQAGVTP